MWIKYNEFSNLLRQEGKYAINTDKLDTMQVEASTRKSWISGYIAGKVFVLAEHQDACVINTAWQTLMDAIENGLNVIYYKDGEFYIKEKE